MVMMMAITPSVNASSRALPMVAGQLCAFDFQTRPHPEEPTEGRRLEGCPRQAWFETRPYGRSSP
jgi:hypothetical protein